MRVTKNGVELQSFLLEGKTDFSFGRDESADVRLSDKAVSREHAILSILNDDQLKVSKKTKFGKLSVNGQDVQEAVLGAGDELTIADYKIQIESDKKAVSAESPAQGSSIVEFPAEDNHAVPQGNFEAITPEVAAQMENQSPGTSGGSVEMNLDLSEASKEAAPIAESAGSAPELAGLSELDASPQLESQQMGEPSGLEPLGGIQTGGSDGSQPIEVMDPVVQSGESGDKTAVLTQAQLIAKLIFKPGQANVEELPITKSEIVVGRAEDCDVILTDKKSSRKQFSIKKAGANFILQDLQSGNGTYVNGEKITQHELNSDDKIRVGDSEFEFKASSQAYFDAEQDFMPVSLEALEGSEQIQESDIPAPHEDTPPLDLSLPGPDQVRDMLLGQQEPQQQQLAQPSFQQPMMATGQPNLQLGQVNSGFSSSGIPGMIGSGPPKKETLLEKFKRQPTPRKILIVGVVLLTFYMALDEEPETKSAKGRNPTAENSVPGAPGTPSAVARKSNKTFDSLPQEKKQFVINTYQLAYDLYKKQQYERSLYEVGKIHQILPDGYKDSSDIKVYAEKALSQLKAAADEKKRREDEEKLRAEIADLVSKAESAVQADKDDDARNFVSLILEKDPENASALRINQMIQEKADRQKTEEAQKRDHDFKKRQLEQLVEEGRKLLVEEKFYEVMEKMPEAPNIGINEPDLLKEALELIQKAKDLLALKVKPVLEEADQALANEDYARARDAFYKALEIDYKNEVAKAGLAKITDILHDKAHAIYMEAIVAESVSDFKTAKSKFRECLDQSMPDDIYHGRCQRKYKRFELIDRTPATTGNSIQGVGGQ
ncbi:MAG: FHA domain-containing protein [Bacteriovoracia bacterium]